MFQNQNPGLPANPLQVNEQGFVQQMPNLPPLQLGRVQQLAEPIVSATIQEVQNHARQNPLRTFLFNLVSQNGWANETFATLAGTVARFTEFLMHTQQMQPQQAIGLAAKEVCTMVSCVFTQKYPNLQQYVSPGQQHEVQQRLQAFQGLQSDLQNFERALQQQQSGWGGGQWSGQQGWGQQAQPLQTGWGNQQRGWNPPQASGWGNQGGWGRGPAMGRPQAAHGNTGQFRDRSNAMWNQGPASGHFQPAVSTAGAGFNSGIHTVGAPSNHEEFTMSPNQTAGDFPKAPPTPKSAQPQAQAPHTEASPVTPSFTQPVGQATWYSVSRDSEWPKVKDRQRPYDAILFEDGSELRPAILSGWDVTRTEERPYPLAFDRLTHVMFHLKKPDGTVIETLKKKTQDMEYLDNELDPVLKASFKKRQRQLADSRSAPNAELLKGFRSVQQSVSVMTEDPEELEELEGNEPQHLGKSILATSAKAANAKAHLLATSKGAGNGDPVEYTFDLVTEVQAPSGMIKAVEDLGQQDSYSDFVEDLVTFQSEGKINGGVYEHLKKAVTRGINEVLDKDLRLSDWTIDSVVGDLSDLQKLLSERFGENALATFEATAPRVLKAACRVLRGEDYGRYLKSLALGEDTDEVAKRLVAFTERAAYTEMPWSLEDFTTRYQTEGVLAKGSAPALYEALESLFDRAKDAGPLTHHYLVTEDGQLIDVRQSVMAEGSFLLKVAGSL